MSDADLIFRKDAGTPSGFSRHRLNPVEQLKRLGWRYEHVTFDPTLKRGAYYILRESRHDGTVIFSEELVAKALMLITSQDSYWKGDEPDWPTLKGIRYRVGWMKIAIVYGIVDLPAGRYPGQRESVRMWVIPEYVY